MYIYVTLFDDLRRGLLKREPNIMQTMLHLDFTCSGTSRIKNSPHLGPYSRAMPRALGGACESLFAWLAGGQGGITSLD